MIDKLRSQMLEESEKMRKNVHAQYLRKRVVKLESMLSTHCKDFDKHRGKWQDEKNWLVDTVRNLKIQLRNSNSKRITELKEMLFSHRISFENHQSKWRGEKEDLLHRVGYLKRRLQRRS